MANIRIQMEIETDWMDEEDSGTDMSGWSNEEKADYIMNQIMNMVDYASMVWISESEQNKLSEIK